MAGIYIHIPFCRKACHYCDFHFSTSIKLRAEMVSAIIKELELQQSYLNGEKIETIYWGGGTPSLLSQHELLSIFSSIDKYYKLDNNLEITLEANPDDLSVEYLRQLKDTPINRLSIGVQSFFEHDLQFMNRAHNATQSITCIKNAQQEGFYNLTIDLIYGTPTMSDEEWVSNLETAFGLGIQHLSCYCLTVEPGTALYTFVHNGTTTGIDEDKAAVHFSTLMEMAEKKGFQHYEISNFCLPGYYSKHNGNYWKGEKYLGIGPSAHSFNGAFRQHNIANNNLYLKSIAAGAIPAEIENISLESRYNEYVLTSLRTMWGTDILLVKNRFGESFYNHFLREALPFLRSKHLAAQGKKYTLTTSGKLLADHIAKHLFA